MKRIVLLGPQRNKPTVSRALEEHGMAGRLAVVTAGWQEREAELESLAEHLLGQNIVDLRLYDRADSVFGKDPDLREAWRERQEWLKELQRLYRRRLRRLLDTVRELDELDGIEALVTRERQEAMDAVRDLDREHLRKIREIARGHWQKWKPVERPAVSRHREEISALLAQCDTLLIAGGHVGVLLNRLRMFELGPLIGHLDLVAWSAGAMALSEQVVLFHDFTPEGAIDEELFDAGLSACRGLMVFPDGSNRLALDDRVRVGQLARRMRPARCVSLDEDSILTWNGRAWHSAGPVRLLRQDGSTQPMDS